MIRFLSQRTTLRKIVLWSFVIVLVIGLGVVFALPSDSEFFGSLRPAPTDTTVVAEVGKYDITLGDLRTQLRSMGSTQAPGRRPQDQPSADALYPTYGKQALDSLVNMRVVRMEAESLGLGATEDEMRERILTMFSPGGRWIGADAYQRYLRDQGLTVQVFESDIADSIMEDKLRNFVTSAVTVSDREVEDDYRRSNTTMTPTFVLVAPKADAAAAPVSDDELRAYFEANRDRFRITQPQRKVTYLFVDQEAVGRTLTIPDEELRQEYDPAKFVSGVRAAEIVFRIPSPDQDSAVLQKAQQVADRARGTADKPGEDFAELARANSENAATSPQGGEIPGWIERASLKPDDPRTRLFSLENNQTTAPIKVENSYVIYKVLERRSRTFEEAREELLTAARLRRGYSRAVEVASEAEEKLRGSKDPQAVAQQVNASLNAPADRPVVSVRETPYVQPGDKLPDLGQNAQFEDVIAGLDEVGEVGAKVGVPGGLAVPMLSDLREPHDATLDEVRDRVLAAYREDKARNDARAAAEQLATAGSPEELRARATAAGYEPKSQENYRAGGTLPGLPASDSIDNALLQLPSGRVSPTPIELPSGFLVLAAGTRTEPDMGAAFNQQRDSIRERLLATKKTQLYGGYIKNRVDQLKESGEIAIRQDVIERAFIFGADFDDEDFERTVPALPPAGTPRPPAAPRPAPMAPVGPGGS